MSSLKTNDTTLVITDIPRWELNKIQDYVNSIDELAIKTNCDCIEKIYDLKVFASRVFPDERTYNENINAEQIKNFISKKYKRIQKECRKTSGDNVEDCVYYDKYRQLKAYKSKMRQMKQEQEEDELLDKVLNR